MVSAEVTAYKNDLTTFYATLATLYDQTAGTDGAACYTLLQEILRCADMAAKQRRLAEIAVTYGDAEAEATATACAASNDSYVSGLLST